MSSSIEEIDEALHHTSLVPLDCRGDGWWAWVDALLEQRAELSEKTGGDTPVPKRPRRKAHVPSKEKR